MSFPIRRLLSTLACVAITVWGIALHGVAYTQGPVRVQVESLESGAFPDVSIVLTVRDANGVSIPDLPKDAIAVVEQGNPRPVTEIRPVVNPELGVSVLLAIDASGGMRDSVLEDTKAAANALIDSLGPKDKMAVLVFGRQVEDYPKLNPDREVDFTTDRNAIRNVVNFIAGESGDPLYDAAFKAVKMTAREPAGRRAIILFTDGADNRSALTADDPIKEAQSNGIPIFTVGLKTPYLNSDFPKRLAATTGGTYHEAASSGELLTLFRNVGDRLKQQYAVRYQSGLPGDTMTYPVKVRVLVQGLPYEADASVQTRLAIWPQATPIVLITPGTARLPATDTGTITLETLALPLLGAFLVVVVLVLLAVGLARRGQPTAAPRPFASTTPNTPSKGVAPAGDRPTGQIPAVKPPMFVPPSVPGTAADQLTSVEPRGAAAGARPTEAIAIGFSPEPQRQGETKVIRVPKAVAWFAVTRGPYQGHRFDLPEGPVPIGRESDNTIVLNEPTVSRRHAKLSKADDEITIQDLASANGTLVNGQKIEGPKKLQDGDVVAVGETVMTLKVVKTGN